MKCPFNGLVKCSDDCMALDKTEFGHRSCKLVDTSEYVEDLAAAVHGLDKTLFAKLCEWASDRLDGYALNDVLRHAGEIEAEMAESYMRLPCDADGVPVRVGDVVEFGENRNHGIVKALNEHMVIAMNVDDGCMNYAKFGLLWNADACRHVKTRTLEDVWVGYDGVGPKAVLD